MAKNGKAKKFRRYRSAADLLHASPILITESQIEFDRVCDAFKREIEPDGIVEQMYVAELAHFTWEIARLQRCKVHIANGYLNAALLMTIRDLQWDKKKDLGKEQIELTTPLLLRHKGSEKDILPAIENLGLDTTVMEAEAVWRSFSDLRQLDGMLASLEARRDRALRRIAEYRVGLSQILRESSDRIIDGKVIDLEKASSKKRPAVA
jgi:hypothetical protein